MAFDPWGDTVEIISNVADHSEAKAISCNDAVIINNRKVTNG